jgi:hypothetical protein
MAVLSGTGRKNGQACCCYPGPPLPYCCSTCTDAAPVKWNGRSTYEKGEEMTRQGRARIMLAGVLASALFVCSSCIYVHSDGSARYEKETQWSAPRAAGSPFLAEARVGSAHTNPPITVRGKIGESMDGAIGGGEGRAYLGTGDRSVTIR